MDWMDQGLINVDWEERINFDRMRRERLQKAKDALAASDADALFVFRTEDCRYLTSYRTHMHPTSMLGNAVVVLPKGGEPFLFTMDHEHCKKRMPWLSHKQIKPRANFREAVGIKAFADMVKEELGELKGRKIGVDLWTPVMTTELAKAFPASEFIDGLEILGKAKIIKTADELRCIKIANHITEAGMDAAIRSLKPGIRECEVLSVAWQTMTAMGSEWTQCSNIVASGPYTAPYRRFTSDRIIRCGDLVIIDIGGCFNGYWGDFTRTWVCGDIKPTKQEIEVHQNCYNALFNACDKSRAGNTNADVFDAAYPYVLDSLGHGSGTHPWEPPYFSPASKKAPVKLEPGMQYNLEPYAGIDGVAGVRLENCLAITDGAPDIFTTYPFDERLLTETHPLDVSTARTRK
jgi:Xaa-Pro aminopeptidase